MLISNNSFKINSLMSSKCITMIHELSLCLSFVSVVWKTRLANVSSKKIYKILQANIENNSNCIIIKRIADKENIKVDWQSIFLLVYTIAN